MSKTSAEHLISLIVHKSDSIISLLDDISIKKFPSDNPKLLIEIINNICIALRDHALELSNDVSALESDDTQNELMMMLYRLVDIAADIRYIDGASVERTPWTLIQPFESFSSKLHPATPIILRPQWHYNFTIRRGLLNEYRQSLNNILKEHCLNKIFNNKPPEIYVISFPSFEKSNILLQSILGHELGHPLATDYLNNEDESYLSDIRDKVDKTLTERDPLKREVKRSKNVNLIKRIRNDGLSEIISDMTDVRLFGFAAIFAAYEIAIMSPMDTVEGRDYFYPPWRYRIRHMLEALDWPSNERDMAKLRATHEDYDAIYQAICNKMISLQDIVKDTTDLDNIARDKELLNIAYESISSALPNIKTFLNTFPTIQSSIDHIFYLCQRIKFNLPPNAIEKDDPFKANIPEIPEIINAGWFYKITYLTEKLTRENYENYIRQVDVLNKLIFKALELSEFSKSYNNHSG